MQTRATVMSRLTLRRIAIISAVLTVLVALDGIYMTVANYHPDDTANNGFGSFHPSDGITVLIAAALLLILTVFAFVQSNRVNGTIVTSPGTVEPSEGEVRAETEPVTKEETVAPSEVETQS